MEDHAMSLIRSGYAVSTRGGFLGALFSALLVLALFVSGAAEVCHPLLPTPCLVGMIEKAVASFRKRRFHTRIWQPTA